MPLVLAVEKVQVQADWLTYATAGATVLAAALAVASIAYSARQARKAERALIRERRLDFELGLLAELSSQHALTGLQHLQGHVRALLAGGGEGDEMPVLRAYTGIASDAGAHAVLEEVRTVGRARVEGAVGRFAADDAVSAAVGAEIADAIERRLSAR